MCANKLVVIVVVVVAVAVVVVIVVVAVREGLESRILPGLGLFLGLAAMGWFECKALG